eukprot:1783079-Pleurochrysis_carterae.AAC.1
MEMYRQARRQLVRMQIFAVRCVRRTSAVQSLDKHSKRRQDSEVAEALLYGLVRFMALSLSHEVESPVFPPSFLENEFVFICAASVYIGSVRTEPSTSQESLGATSKLTNHGAAARTRTHQ